MASEERVTPKRMRGPGMGPGGPAEKAKDFKGSMKRLFKELKKFRILIYISLILAVLSAVLSITAPNNLSKLTDKISEGLVVNSRNMEELSKIITANLSEENIKTVISSVLDFDLSQEKVAEIMKNPEISNQDKQEFQTIMSEISKNQNNAEMLMANLPESILKEVLSNSVYSDIEILADDKIALLKNLSTITASQEMSVDILDKIPQSIKECILKDFQMDKIRVSTDDQVEFLKIMSTIDKDNINAESLYSKIDQMPDTIKEIVEPKMDIDSILNIAKFLAGLYILSALFNFIQSIMMTDVANKFAKNLRSRISVKINKLPLRYYDKHTTGDILSRVTNDVDTIAQSMNQSLATLVSSITLFAGTIIMMFYTNWIMAITAILASILGFVFMFLILGKSQKYFVARQTELGALNGHIEEIYSGLNVVKVYNGQKEADKKFDELNKNVYNANMKSQFLSGLMPPIMNFIGNFGYVAVCIVGAILTMNDMISFGVIVAFMTYVRLFTNPLSQIAQAMTSLQTTGAASERVFEFLDEPEMSDQSEIKRYLAPEDAKGDIEFKNVVFQYDNNDKPTIKNFSASAKSGQKIAIVGPTGAGKTTLVNLLMKFYDIDSGDILIDGISTKELTRENIHDLFTMVLQDTWLFDGTIKENIIYNGKDITDKQIDEICKVVGIDHFIKTLPHGYDSKLSDNDSVSAGQRQLFTIARAMTQKTPFLILDEATSNVDTRTEELVQEAMDKLTEGKTSFIIAHRLSTIKNSDLILVVKDGNIIEQGNHDELIKMNGFYAELYNSQFESCKE